MMDAKERLIELNEKRALLTIEIFEQKLELAKSYLKILKEINFVDKEVYLGTALNDIDKINDTLEAVTSFLKLE